MRTSATVVTTAAAIAIMAAPICNAEGLTGAARNDFVEETFKSCFQSQTTASVNQSLPPAILAQYCLCFSDQLADRTSPEDLKMIDAMVQTDKPALAAKMQPTINAVAERCAYTLK